MLSDFIPMYLRKLWRKRLIQKRFGSDCRIATETIHESARIGKNVYLAHDTDIRSNVQIGDYSYCSPGTILFDGTIIGKYCSIGYGVQIGCPEHPAHFLSTSPTIYRDAQIRAYLDWPADDILQPVKIGNDVWIGSNAVILQGCCVGDGAVIAAGAVVTKDVPPFSIWGGVPAKCIAMRFDQETQERIASSKWWDQDMDQIRAFAKQEYEHHTQEDSL